MASAWKKTNHWKMGNDVSRSLAHGWIRWEDFQVQAKNEGV